MQGYLNRACLDFLKDGEVLVKTVEGVTGTLQYLRKDYLGQPLYYRLVTDGYSMASNDRGASRYMRLFAYFPEAVLPNPKSALLICFGTGSTASALVEDKRLERIDVVDISRDVLAGSQVVYSQPGANPLDDPVDDQLCRVIGDAAQGRSGGKDKQADQEQLLGPKQIAQPAGGDQQHRVDQDVRVQDPQDLR